MGIQIKNQYYVIIIGRSQITSARQTGIAKFLFIYLRVKKLHYIKRELLSSGFHLLRMVLPPN